VSQSSPQSRGLPNLVASAPEWTPDIDARVSSVGMWIFMGANAMLFVAFFFAFFYLRSLNNGNDWMPAWVVHPNRRIAGIMVLLLIAAAGLVVLGARSVGKTPATARMLFWLALLAGVLYLGFQVYEFKHLGFDPQFGGGYVSVFVGLKAVLMAEVVVAMIWLGTHIAQATPIGDTTARPASAAAFGNLMVMLAGVGVVAYLVLYFI
jgi:heme/copper-type cytochrome/quinol oxidase subunit 3